MTTPDLSTGGIEEIERVLRAPATSFRELLLAGDKFARLADYLDALPPSEHVANEVPLRKVLFNLRPTVGDIRKLRDALVVAGWRKEDVLG